MPWPRSRRTQPDGGSRLALLALAWIAAACASPAPTRSVQVETPAGPGFTIRESAKASASVRADFERAVRMLEQGRYPGGIELLVQVTQAAPGLVAAHIDLGMAYARVDDLEHAEASLARALELEPDHPVALNELGIVQRRQGKLREARASYEKALAAHPEFHFARRNLGVLCDLYLHDVQCALDSYERVARAVPGDEKVAMWARDLRNRSGKGE